MRKANFITVCVVGIALGFVICTASSAEAGEKDRSARIDQHLAQAKGELAAGNYKGAAQLYRKALAIQPRQAEARFALGETYRQWGKNYEARRNFRLAMSSRPADKSWEGRCRMKVASCWEASGHDRQAMLEYQLALAANPQLAEARVASKRLASTAGKNGK